MSLEDTTTATPNEGVSVPGESAPQAEAPASAPATDDMESRARAQGWAPQDEFRGPADKWRSAEEFVRKGEEDLPVLRERLRATTGKLTEIERRAQESEAQFTQRVQALERMTTVALSKQRDQLASAYAAAMRDAVQSGDTVRFDQLRRDEAQALGQFDQQAWEAQQPRQAQPQQTVPLPADAAQARDSWIKDNPWFLYDGEMNAVAQQRHMALLKERPDLPLADNLKEVRNHVAQRYPEKFPQPRKSAGVEGGGRMPSSAEPRAKGASDLPADARAQGAKFVQQGLFKDLNEYAREYYSQD